MKRTSLLSMPFAALLVLCAATAAPAMYHPTLGRWTARDPIGPPLEAPASAMPNAAEARFTLHDATKQYSDGMNLYQYVRANPCSLADPMGLGCCGLNIDEAFRDMLLRLQGRANMLSDADKTAIGGGLPGTDAWRFLAENGTRMDFTVRKRDGHPSGQGCEGTVTLCGKCIHNSQVNNMVFGFMAAYVGFDSGATNLWANVHEWVSHRGGETSTQRSSYALGSIMQSWTSRPEAPTTVESMCATFNQFGGLLGKAAQGKKYDNCEKCTISATIEDVTSDFSRTNWTSNDGSQYKVPSYFPPW